MEILKHREKYPTKYRGNSCPVIGNTGEISVRCEPPPFFCVDQFVSKVMFSRTVSVLSVSLHSRLAIGDKKDPRYIRSVASTCFHP